MSIHECFVKENQIAVVRKEKKKRASNVGKGQFWCIHPDHLDVFVEDEDGLWIYTRPSMNEKKRKRKRKGLPPLEEEKPKRKVVSDDEFSRFEEQSEPEKIVVKIVEEEISSIMLPTPVQARPNFSSTPGQAKYNYHLPFSSGIGQGESLIMSSELVPEEEEREVGHDEDFARLCDSILSLPPSRNLTPSVKIPSVTGTVTETRRQVLGALTNLQRHMKLRDETPGAPLLPRKTLLHDEILAPAFPLSSPYPDLGPRTPRPHSPLTSPGIPPKKRRQPHESSQTTFGGALLLSSPPGMQPSSRFMSPRTDYYSNQ